MVKCFEGIHHILIYALFCTCLMVQLFKCFIKRSICSYTFPSKSDFLLFRNYFTSSAVFLFCVLKSCLSKFHYFACCLWSLLQASYFKDEIHSLYTYSQRDHSLKFFAILNTCNRKWTRFPTDDVPLALFPLILSVATLLPARFSRGTVYVCTCFPILRLKTFFLTERIWPQVHYKTLRSPSLHQCWRRFTLSSPESHLCQRANTGIAIPLLETG